MSPGRAAAAAAVLAVLVHLGALSNGFAFDDNVLILGDEGLRQFSGLLTRLMEPSWPAAFGDEIGAWRPVTTGSWALTWIASNGSVVAFHALGVALHALATALGVLVLVEFMPLSIAAAAGLLFAVHPVHVEAVANIAGTAEPLSAVFALAALLIHVRGGRSYGLGRIIAVTAAYTVALLAKEGAVIVPILFVLVDGARWDVRVTNVGSYIRDRWALYAALTVALAIVMLGRLDVIGDLTAASYPQGGAILRTAPRSWTVFSTWPHYLRLLVFPLDLSADYGTAVVPLAFSWTWNAILGAVVGLGAFGGAFVLWRRGKPMAPDTVSDRVPALAVLWVAAAVLPVANILYLAPVLVAERTLYLASWGAALFGGWLVVSLVQRRQNAGYAVLAALVLAGSLRTMTRVPDWDSSESIMGTLIEAHPESGNGWMYLARQLSSRGQADQALTAFSYGVALLNSGYRPSTDVASHLMSMGRPASAVFFLRRAWREEPGWYTAPGLLAAAELGMGRPERAAPPARAAVLLDPENASMHHLLAQSLAGLGEWDGAVAARRASIENGFGERAGSWLLLGQELLNTADTAGAAAAVDSAAVRTMNENERSVMSSLRAAIQITPPR